MNCIALLSDDADVKPGVALRKQELGEFVNHWKRQASRVTGKIKTLEASHDH